MSPPPIQTQRLNWDAIKDRHPWLAQRILEEYNRRNGFLPYEQGYLYMLHACGTSYYKLGKTTSPDRRLLQISPKMPFSVRFIRLWRSNFMSMAETWLHNSFAPCRTNGEWFELTDMIVRQLLSSSNPYGEGIRHAYNFQFLNALAKDSEQREAIAELIEKESNQAIDLNPHITDAKITAWIEELFRSIEADATIFPDDIEQIRAKGILELSTGRL